MTDCAHCGARAEVKVRRRKGTAPMYAISCARCGISTRYHKYLEAAWRDWNRRPSSALPEGLTNIIMDRKASSC